MLRDSLIQFLSTRIEEWPEWLPVIVHDLGDVDSKRSWNEQQDVGVILQSGIVLDSEVESLKMMVEEENYQIVQLWNRVSGFPLSEEGRIDLVSKIVLTSRSR